MLNIGGFKASSLINYPGYAAAIVFTNGCNMRCAYCHNGNLALGEEPSISEDDILDKLKQNLRFCKTVVISGGEPTLQGDAVLNFCKKLKEIGITRIKLDTNGTLPDVVHALLKHNLINYIAMDIKSIDHYNNRNVQRTIDLLYRTRNTIHNPDRFDFEFRTTLDKGYIKPEDIETILRHISSHHVTWKDEQEECCTPVWYIQQCNIPEPQILSIDKTVCPYTDDDIDIVVKEAIDFQVVNFKWLPIRLIRRISY
jgi:pyruvate formate lyase activating enzyme